MAPIPFIKIFRVGGIVLIVRKDIKMYVFMKW